jgi:hypothetical protein
MNNNEALTAEQIARRAARAAVLAHLTVETTTDGPDAEAAYMEAFGD